MLIDYSSCFYTLNHIRLIYIEIIAVTIVISILILIIHKVKKNAYTEYFVKEAIVMITLVGIFVIPQTIALCFDTNENAIIFEQNVECSVDNNISLINGFDYLLFYDSVKLENGKTKIINTISEKIPDGTHRIDIVYAKHSRILLDYKIIDSTN